MGRLRQADAVLIAVLAALSGCPTAPFAPCNADADCDDGQSCLLGACAAKPGAPMDAGPPDAGIADAGPPDAGAADAGPPDAGGCLPDEHDGGDGTCVARGRCVEGFGLYYLDADLDGVGAGLPSEDCAPLPLAPGYSEAGSDCEPEQPDRFQLQQGFDERDGDGVTAGVVELCVGDVPEQGVLDEARGPPVLAYAVSAASSGSNNQWNSVANAKHCCGGTAAADLDPAAATATLVLSDFTCLAQPPYLERLRVRARARLPLLVQQEHTLTTELSLLHGGGLSVLRSISSTWSPSGFFELSVEGTPADWGIDAIEPAELCAGGLELHLRVAANGSYGGNVELDFAVIELFGGDDCDPNDPARFAPLSLYGDADNDSYEGGAPIAGCVGDEELALWDVLFPSDCDDADARAHPGQSAYYGSPRTGGGFDFDCNGSEEKRSVTDAAGCVENSDGTCAASGTTSRSGDCGAWIDADDCPAAPPCELIQDSDQIACR